MKRILIVDDEKPLLESLRTGLEALSGGYGILVAENGKQALETMKAEPVDLLITDLKMPVMDGFELLVEVNRSFPFVHIMVMTAFGTPEIEQRLRRSGAFTVLEKPIDFDQMADIVKRKLAQSHDEDTVYGISLEGFLQLIEMEEKTCLLEVCGDNGSKGFIYLKEGVPYDATFEGVLSEKAIYKMLALEKVRINFKPLPRRRIKRRLQTSIMSLLLDSARQVDEEIREEGRGADQETVEDAPSQAYEDDDPSVEDIDAYVQQVEEQEDDFSAIAPTPSSPEDDDLMALLEQVEIIETGEPTFPEPDEVRDAGELESIRAILEKFRVVSGFRAIGVFSPDGEMVAESHVSGIRIEEAGALANDVLLKAQQAAGMMDIGQGKQLHLEADRAHILVRCLDESAGDDETAPGKAHLHMVFMLARDGNLAMGKMKLEAAIGELAPYFR